MKNPRCFGSGAIGLTLLCALACKPSPSSGLYALPADRVTQWKPGVTYNGGIPSGSWPVYATLTPSGGDDSTAINDTLTAAHAAHPGGVVVLLGAGTFNLTSTYVAIATSNTVLRGAGAGQTFLHRTNGAVTGSGNPDRAMPNVIIGPSRWPLYDTGTSTSQLLASDAAKESTTVTLVAGGVAAAGLTAGMFVLVDETSGAAWQADPQGRGQVLASAPWPGSTSSSNVPEVVWWAHKPAFANDDPVTPLVAPTAANGYAAWGGAAASWFSRQDRPQAEVKEIVSIARDTITFSTPLHKAFRTGHHAQVTAPGDGGIHASNHISHSGVEAMTFSNGDDGSVRFEWAAYSWARNIEVTDWLNEGIAINGSFRVEVRDSYLHRGAFPVPGGGGYCLSLANASAEILYENNINILDNKVMVVRASGAGSVIGYNYMDMGFIQYQDTWNEIGLNGSHMVGGYQMLFEGNWGFNFDSDSTHGSATRHTVFRNWLRGWRSTFTNFMPCTGGTSGGCSSDEPIVNDAHDLTLGVGTSDFGGPYRAAGGCRYSYFFNFVGNVMGESGGMSGWAESWTAGAFNNTNKGSIWLLGLDPDVPYPANDAWSTTTDLRDGNYDFVSDSQQWLSTPGFSGALPTSLYLSTAPTFFGSNTWPWVDPTTGTTYTLPAKARYDAGTPNTVP